MRLGPDLGGDLVARIRAWGTFVKKFVGLSSAESVAVFNLLQTRVTRLENIIRWTWEQGDVAVWDNRATQHHAAPRGRRLR